MWASRPCSTGSWAALALVDDQPGVTRDLREGEARLGALRFT
jgi:predicted GTPase